MPIEASTPKVEPPVAERTFDQWTLTRLFIDTPSPNEGGQAHVQLRRYRINPDTGQGELAPDTPDNVVNFTMDDLIGQANANPALGQVMDGVLAIIKSIGTNMGLL